MKKFIVFILCLSVCLSTMVFSFPVSAAFYTQTITDSSTITKILNMVKQNDGQNMYNKMYYIFYQSQFAAAYNKKFPYPNSGSSHKSVVDNGTTYTLEGASRGCYLYADYVSKYVYGFGSWSSSCKSIWINQTAGTMTVQDVKNTIMTNAQAGEHIYVAGNVHSVSFVAYDSNGFYYTNYRSDSSPYIYIHYTTWENFKNECNSKGQRACFLDFNRTPNNNSENNTVTISSQSNKNTITNTNAILWGKVDKPSDYAVAKIGIKIRRDDSTYENGWSKYEAPSKDYVGYSYMEPYYNMNTELNITLRHATTYYYKFYAKVNGKEYWSAEYSIKTTGSHSFGPWSTTKSATCITAGTKKRTCSCGKYETETIPATGIHNFNVEPVSDATCTESAKDKFICYNCDYEVIVSDPDNRPALGHTYSNNCDKSCNVCGKIRTVGAHKYSNNCDTTCNYCGARRTIKHTYSNSCDTTCNVCKTKRTIKHTYSNNCDTSCNVCKATRSITHAYKTTTTKATLSKNGSIVKKCTVCGKVASKSTIKYVKSFKLSTTTYTYDGKVKTPRITVKDSAGKKLKKNTDYTVSYASGRKNVGTYKVTIKMKGKYSGTKTLTFKINPAKTTVSKLTAGKKSITVAITKKSTQVTGYQIQYSTSKTFSKATTKTISSYKTTKYTLKSLSAKKTYYVRVRTYKIVGKTKHYSGWSTCKYVKTK